MTKGNPTMNDAPQAQHPIAKLHDQLMSRAKQFELALPPHMAADRFIRVVITACNLNPDLLACDRATLFNSAMRCAQDGLLPDSREAALVPFKNKVQYLPMYGGLLKKFRNSGQFKWVATGIVYEGETYEHWITQDGEHFKHIPGDDNTDKKILRVYALATTKDGGSFIADLPLSDINKRRAMSRATREDAPWKQWTEEMMRKTAIRVLSKLLPMSSDLDAMMQRDEEALLGVESVEEVRREIADRSSTQSTLDHFGGEIPQSDVDSEQQQTDSAPAESQTNQEQIATESATTQTESETQPRTESTYNPKSMAEYKDMVRERIVKTSLDEIDTLRAWFVSDQQRKLRNNCGMVSAETDELRSMIEQRAKMLAKGKS
jgi:recombination protein RecT